MADIATWLENQVQVHRPKTENSDADAVAVADACIALSGGGGAAFGLFPPAGGYPERERLAKACLACLAAWLPLIEDPRIASSLVQKIDEHSLNVAVPDSLRTLAAPTQKVSPSISALRAHIAQHASLRLLRWNDPWLELEASLSPKNVAVTVEVVTEENLVLQLATATRVTSDLEQVVERALELAARELLAIINGGYRDPKDPPLTASEFEQRVKPLLGLVSIDAETGGFSLAFDDDELLWGHSIHVEFDENAVPIDVSFVG